MQQQKHDLHTLADDEALLLYSDSNTKLHHAWVGRLRGDFGLNGNRFWHTWFPYTGELLTQQFKNDLQKVIDALRRDGLLKNLQNMKDYCLQHPEAIINDDIYPSYGFKVDTEAYQFYIRCFPYPGDYQFNIYSYSKTSANNSKRKEVTIEK